MRLWALAMLVAGPAAAQDDELKEGQPTPRYPDYTYEDEVPRQTLTVPGASSGVLFGRHTYGDPFLGRWRADYLNYGFKDYENYRLNTTPYLRTYDAFGNYIADGYEVFALEEYRTRDPEIGSLERKGRFYQNWLRHLVIADDVYGGWSTRLMAGDFIRTTFTPLTLDLTALNGIRLDAMSSSGSQLTLLTSRVSDPIELNAGAFLSGRGQIENVNDGAYLVGGHWESDVGEALTLGASYVNLYRFDSLRGVRKNSRKGLAPRNSVPRQIIVRFEDDSPEDARGGATVFDFVAHVRLAPAVDDPEGQDRVVDLAPASVNTSPGVVVQARHWEASGFYRTEQGLDAPVNIEYVFDVPTEAKAVEFEGLLANDYKISMRQDHFFVTDPVRGSGENKRTEFSTIRRAEGNVADMSNKGLVRFDYGLATGVEVMGVNGKAQLSGLDVRAEIAKSNNYYQFPALVGGRSSLDDVAGFVTATKTWSRFAAGVEVFEVGPKYTTHDPLGEVFYFNQARQSPYRNQGTVTNNPFYALVDDNDNLLYNESPDNWVNQGAPVEVTRGATGIFPFFDLDQDGHQDTNQNRNEFPDYDEPFLMYFTDPQEFYFGDDFNNNSITDAWEDDDLPNYPYYKDERGGHLLGSVDVVDGVKLSAGSYRVRQIAGGGRNEVLYGRFDADRRLGSRWRLRWQHESKDAEDDIPNDYRLYLLREGVRPPGYAPRVFRDRLEARDSFANRGLLHVECRPAPGWRLEGKLRYELNHQHEAQFDSGESQREDDIGFLGAVLRSDYTYQWGDLALKPRLKVLYSVTERRSLAGPTTENLQVVPILRADYRLTSRSLVRVGVQGLPGFRERRRDFVDDALDSSRRTWTLMWFSESEYEGFRIGTEVGVTRQEIDFDAPGSQDADFTRFFVRMISAVGSSVR